MPKKVERALRKEGRKRGLSGDALDNFVFGIMVKRGLWNPPKKKKEKS